MLRICHGFAAAAAGTAVAAAAAAAAAANSYSLWDLFSFSRSHCALAQPLLDHAYHCLRIIEVPNSNDSHIFGPVPTLVECQHL